MITFSLRSVFLGHPVFLTPCRAHLLPQLTTPTKLHESFWSFLVTRGPPLSPWQESFPPFPPAHIIPSKILFRKKNRKCRPAKQPVLSITSKQLFSVEVRASLFILDKISKCCNFYPLVQPLFNLPSFMSPVLFMTVLHSSSDTRTCSTFCGGPGVMSPLKTLTPHPLTHVSFHPVKSSPTKVNSK